MRIPSLTGVIFLALCASAVAQTKFCIAGDLDSLTPVQVAACQAKSADLRTEARLHGAPADWHFVVICDEGGWSQYASFSGNKTKMIMNAAQNTDRDLRFTFVRGSRIEAGNTESLDLVLASLKKDMPAQGLKPLPTARPVVNRQLLTASNAPVSTQQQP